MSFLTIKESILKLEDLEIQETFNTLMDQLNSFIASANYSYDDAKEIVFEDADALDLGEVEEETELWEEIRGIQHSMVNMFT